MNWSKKGAAIGAASGTVVGGGVGYLAGAGTKDVGVQTVAGVVIGGLLGVAAGALLPPLFSSTPTPPPGSSIAQAAALQGAGMPPKLRSSDHLLHAPEHQWAITPSGKHVFRSGNRIYVDGVWHTLAGLGSSPRVGWYETAAGPVYFDGNGHVFVKDKNTWGRVTGTFQGHSTGKVTRGEVPSGLHGTNEAGLGQCTCSSFCWGDESCQCTLCADVCDCHAAKPGGGGGGGGSRVVSHYR